MTTGTAGQTALVYPETDGMPLPDGEFQAPLYREIVSTLQTHFKALTNARVNGDTFIYYQEGDPRRRVAPDCYVSFDVSPQTIERHNNYRLWEVGKPPDFVLEIGSPSTAATDLVEKRGLYARLGIAEYWRYDSTGGDYYGEPLVGEYLLEGEYRRFELKREPDDTVWAHSPALNLDLCWDSGRLRFYDPAAREWLLNQEEEQAAKEAEQAAKEAEQAAKQAAQERALAAEARALAAEARASVLEAELRRLRGE